MAKPKLGMSENDVKRYFADRMWEKFEKWIKGQTCPLDGTGHTNYYENDVERFTNMYLFD